MKALVTSKGRVTIPKKVLGCLKAELEGRNVSDLIDELRGPVELPKRKHR